MKYNISTVEKMHGIRYIIRDIGRKKRGNNCPIIKKNIQV